MDIADVGVEEDAVVEQGVVVGEDMVVAEGVVVGEAVDYLDLSWPKTKKQQNLTKQVSAHRPLRETRRNPKMNLKRLRRVNALEFGLVVGD